jgi:delta14-sterol reductase
MPRSKASSEPTARSKTPVRTKSPARKSATAAAAATTVTNEAHDSFGSPLVKVLVLVGAPVLVQLLWAACDLEQCHAGAFVEKHVLAAGQTFGGVLDALLGPISLRSVAWMALWFISQAALRLVTPGRWVDGYVQRDGQRLRYVLNGASCLVATLALGAVAASSGWLDLAALEPRTGELRGLVALFQALSFAIPVLLIGKARWSNLGEKSGSLLTDYFFGCEINPRIGDSAHSDIKFFLETHALIMWMAWDALFLWQQYARDGVISSSLALTVGVQAAYVAHHFHDESFLLGILDFTSENMGWMLTWGNVMFVGFFFALPPFYASQNPTNLWWVCNASIALLAAFGLYVFSSANHQKHQFKTDPSKHIWGAPPRAMPTARGTKLLLSGWWGVARKVNYTGDLIIALCHGLPCGFAIMPHVYFLYLFALLVHRAVRDDAMCAAKYGKDWQKYCLIVPYQFVPNVY